MFKVYNTGESTVGTLLCVPGSVGRSSAAVPQLPAWHSLRGLQPTPAWNVKQTMYANTGNVTNWVHGKRPYIKDVFNSVVSVTEVPLNHISGGRFPSTELSVVPHLLSSTLFLQLRAQFAVLFDLHRQLLEEILDLPLQGGPPLLLPEYSLLQLRVPMVLEGHLHPQGLSLVLESLEVICPPLQLHRVGREKLFELTNLVGCRGEGSQTESGVI